MPTNFNVQMLTNVLASALTSTLTAWLSYLAAWSHFSSSDNTALATILAAGLSTGIGIIATILINRWSVIANNLATGGTKIVTTDQKTADSLPNNPNVMSPAEAKVNLK